MRVFCSYCMRGSFTVAAEYPQRYTQTCIVTAVLCYIRSITLNLAILTKHNFQQALLDSLCVKPFCKTFCTHQISEGPPVNYQLVTPHARDKPKNITKVATKSLHSAYPGEYQFIKGLKASLSNNFQQHFLWISWRPKPDASLKATSSSRQLPSKVYMYQIQFWEKVYFRSQILERPSIDEFWNIFSVPVLPENVIFTFFRTCWSYSETYNTGTQNWSSIVQYSRTSIWDFKYTFSQFCFQHFSFCKLKLAWRQCNLVIVVCALLTHLLYKHRPKRMSKRMKI